MGAKKFDDNKVWMSHPSVHQIHIDMNLYGIGHIVEKGQTNCGLRM